MDEIRSISIGDLVSFINSDNLLVRLLWEEPDYGPKSLDVKFSVTMNDLLVVLDLKQNENVLILGSDGNCGWTRTNLLIIRSRIDEAR